MSKLAAQSRITIDQFATSKKWTALSRAYRAIVSGLHDRQDPDAGAVDRRLSSARLDQFERQVIRRYRTLAPIMGPLERGIIEGRGRYPRTLDELCAVRRALDEIAERWVEAGV
jgi:hypothetical protein